MDEERLTSSPDTDSESGQGNEERTDHGEEVEREIGDLTETLKSREQPAGPAPQSTAPPFWRSWPVAISALLVAVVLTAANLAGLGPYRRSPPEPTAREQEHINELELLALVGYIEDYRAEHGRLPDSVDQLDVDFGTTVVDYELIDEDEFVVTVSKGRVLGTYDSRRPQSEPPSSG